MAASEQKLNKIFDQNVQITGDLTVDGNLVGYSGDNFYLDGITKSGNTLTFSVNGATNQSYTFGSAAFANTTDFAAASHTHSYLPLSGGTLTGALTLTGGGSINLLTLSGSSPTLAFTDVTSGADDFYIHVNSNNFYILRDQGGVGTYGDWDSPHPLQLEADTGNAYVYGNTIITSGNIGSQSVSYATSAGDASTLDGLDSVSFLRDDGWNTSPGQNANTQTTMRSDFTYANNAPYTGELIRFGASGYSLQLNAAYIGGNDLAFRTYNNDGAQTWNPWKIVIHTGNKDSYTYPPASHNHDGVYVKEGGTSFSGEYPVVVRTSADVIYSDANIKFRGSDSRLTVDGSIETPRVKVTGSHNGNFGYASFSWGGSSGYPTLFSDHTDRWVMHVKPHIVWTQNGQRGYTGQTEGSMIRFEGNLGSTVSWDAGCLTDIASGGDYWGVARSGSWAFYSDPSLNLHANSSMRAPIFYDSNNTAWYTNPADRSILNTLQLGGSSSDTTNLKLDVQGNMAIRGSSGLYYGVTTNNYNSWTTRMYASSSTQYLNAQQFIFDNQGYGSTTFLTVNTNGIYAPRFYDSSDTNYYVNPNGVSYMNQIDGPYFRNIQIPQSGLGSSYDERVLLLIPKVETASSYNNRVHGKFTIGKTGGNVIDYFDVEAQSVYNNTTASFTSSGQRTGHKFVTCTYNGIKWLAIKFNYTANPYNYAWFHGHAITNFSTQAQTDMLKIISYVDLQSGTTVLNSEIYNSIADYTPDPLHKTMHNGSNSSYNMHSRLNLYAPSSGWEDGLNLYASDKTNKWNLLVDNGASDMFRVAFNSSEKFRIQTNGEVYTIGTGLAGSDYRAPIFYDSNDTGYYIDPNTTATSARFRGKTVYGPNTSWGKYLQVGGNGREYVDNANYASVVTTNGNLHLDAASGYDTYINFYDGGNVRFGGGATAETARIASDGSARFPIYYDYNDTYYYVNPASDSRQNNITANRIGVNPSGSSTSRYGVSLYGGYNSGEPTYGLLFTGTSLGTHGSVTGSWATYFTMNNDNTRGWIFRRVGSGNCASISGGGTASFNGDVIAYYSDMRLKTKLGDIEDPIGKIQTLNGFYYEPNEIAESYGYEKETRVGLSAQEVEAVLPEIVTDAPIGDGYKTVDYAKLVPVLVEAIKEQQKQIDELKSLINKS